MLRDSSSFRPPQSQAVTHPWIAIMSGLRDDVKGAAEGGYGTLVQRAGAMGKQDGADSLAAPSQHTLETRTKYQ